MVSPRHWAVTENGDFYIYMKEYLKNFDDENLFTHDVILWPICKNCLLILMCFYAKTSELTY
ncbi:hypothetical protein M153_12200001051 [Pseudoloma neurophilia]|uniref:Uncharacterized protein n=1 Tax=Pseudoloma neurophilia TaxID=146866 RepID=A0A0R0LVL2_9MICR|nr:hypothetical protein M153_12200001051 [Pseudoloma neurophilia]